MSLPPCERGAGGIEPIAYHLPMHIPYRPHLKLLSRELRANMTPTEKIFWYKILHSVPFSDYRFLRQKPLLNYIVDFYCSKLKVMIEIDGESHIHQVEYDKKRSADLEVYGIRVIRYTNHEIFSNLHGVCEDLLKQLWL